MLSWRWRNTRDARVEILVVCKCTLPQRVDMQQAFFSWQLGQRLGTATPEMAFGATSSRRVGLRHDRKLGELEICGDTLLGIQCD
jgi:hypothetical protein